MCVWVAKKKGMDMVDVEERKSMWEKNPHGAGIMWTQDEDKKVHYAKGFTTNDEFEKFLKALDLKIGLKDRAVVLHYRISTTKSKKPNQTHPFFITDDEKKILSLKGYDDVVFCHNGSANSFYDYNTKMSDSQNFSLQVLSKMAKIDNEFYKKEFFRSWIESLTSSEEDNYNRFCFLDKDGEIFTVGDVIEEDGYVYANHNHRGMKDYTDTYYKSIGKKLLMPLSLRISNEKIFIVSDRGYVLDSISKTNENTYAIDSENNVYRKLSHIDRYEFIDYYQVSLGKAINGVNRPKVTFNPIFADTQNCVEYDIDKLIGTFENRGI